MKRSLFIIAYNLLCLSVFAQLSGSYTINPGIAASGTNYLSFSDAVSDLTSGTRSDGGTVNGPGVSSAVIFSAADGTYAERLNITAISGTSMFNTVTFSSASGDSSKVSLAINATTSPDNFVVKLSSADYIRFTNLTLENRGNTFSQVLVFENGADFNEISNCVLRGDSLTTVTSTDKAVIFSGGSSDYGNQFQNNLVIGGNHGMYYIGLNSSKESGTVIQNNEFINQSLFGIYVGHQSDLVIRNNRIEVVDLFAPTHYGIRVEYNSNAHEVSGNKILCAGSGYGLHLSGCIGSFGSEGQYFNNWICVGDTLSSGNSYGIYLTNSIYQHIVNNSVSVVGLGGGSRALSVATAGSNNNTILNNIFYLDVPPAGDVVEYSSTGAVVSDYNVFFSPQANLISYAGTAYSSLSAYQAASGKDQNSKVYDPMFAGWFDLNFCNDSLSGAATYLSWISTDIEGKSRPNPFAIGATEKWILSGFGLGADTTFCQASGFTAGTETPNVPGTFQWNTGETSQYITPAASGQYILTFTSFCGTAHADTMNLTMDSLPVAAFSFNISGAGFNYDFTDLSGGSPASWSWDFGDGNNANTQNPNHTYTSSGSYTVTLIVTNSCGSDTFSMPLTVTGMDEEIEKKYVVYPNPSAGEFKINFAGEFGGRIEVCDLNGKILIRDHVSGSNHARIDLKSQPAGIYILKLESPSHTAYVKLIRQ